MLTLPVSFVSCMLIVECTLEKKILMMGGHAPPPLGSATARASHLITFKKNKRLHQLVWHACTMRSH